MDAARIGELMECIGRAATAAAQVLALTPSAQKDAALAASAAAVRARVPAILAANGHDLAAARARHLSGPRLERLRLDEGRIEAIAAGIEAVKALARPHRPRCGRVAAAQWAADPAGHRAARGHRHHLREPSQRHCGRRCAVPEVRQRRAFCAAAPRAEHSSARDCTSASSSGLTAAGLPAACIQLVPTSDRAAVGYMLAGMSEYIDVIVPRGGKSLVARVQQEARVPVIGHLEGNCHVYVDRDADLGMARAIALNAKMRRTGICGAAETLLVDARLCRDASCAHHPRSARGRLRGARRRGGAACRFDACIRRARTTGTPSTSMRSSQCASSTGVDAAIAAHCALRLGPYRIDRHRECRRTAERFLQRVDSAIVLHNASTQFADGGEFGMGAEIGISTDRFHARGPVGRRAAHELQVRGAWNRAGAPVVVGQPSAGPRRDRGRAGRASSWCGARPGAAAQRSQLTQPESPFR